MRVVRIQEKQTECPVRHTVGAKEAMATRASSACALGAPQRSNGVNPGGENLRHEVTEGC